MNAVIGQVLPLAVGIAVSPLPIILAILLLVSPRAKTSGTGFVLGWVLGIAVAVSAFTLLSSALPVTDSPAPSPVRGTVEIALGGLFLVISLRSWRSRPRTGEPSPLPRWMTAIDTLTFSKSIGIGFLLAAVNPKNLLMAAAAGVALGGAALDSGTALVATIFTLVAASTVVVPVIAYLAATDRMAEPLDTLRTWLLMHNNAIMTVLTLVIGIKMIGDGIASF